MFLVSLKDMEIFFSGLFRLLGCGRRALREMEILYKDSCRAQSVRSLDIESYVHPSYDPTTKGHNSIPIRNPASTLNRASLSIILSLAQKKRPDPRVVAQLG